MSSLRNSRPRTSGCKVIAVDLISELPETIITEILNLLPAKDAVATSVLSRSWRFRWKEVTTFDIKVRSTGKFHLSWWTETPMYFVRTAISAIPPTVRVLRILDLDSDDQKSNVVIEIPPEIYTCKTLEVMKLDGGIFKVKLPDVVCLPKLAELELNWVRYQSDQTISELVHSCPVLQSLALKMRIPAEDRTLTVSSLTIKRLHLSCFASPRENLGYGKKLINIDAPSLEYLELHDSVSNDISLHGLSSLNEVEIDVYGPIRPNSLVQLLESFQGVKILKLSSYFVSRLAKATRKFSTSFQRLTKLVVDFSFSSRSNWLVDLIDQCVNLKILKVYNGRSSVLSPPVAIPGCLSSRLQTLEAAFRLPLKSEFDLKMIEFILRHGLVLKRVDLCFEIFCSPSDIDDAEACQKIDGIVEKVLEMPKSSPNCKFSSEMAMIIKTNVLET